jgi:catechol 2,3-dioxygenase-like lactoylglutathione lyase family enzyme
MPPALRLDHVQLAVPAAAEDACRAFWQGLVGLTEIEKPEALRPRGGAWFAGPGFELHLGVEAEFRPARKAHPAFAVADLPALAERLKAAGHPVRWDEAIAGRARFFTEDPVGNRLEFLAG